MGTTTATAGSTTGVCDIREWSAVACAHTTQTHGTHTYTHHTLLSCFRSLNDFVGIANSEAILSWLLCVLFSRSNRRFSFMVVLALRVTADCTLGQRLDQTPNPDVCVDCPVGTYQPVDWRVNAQNNPLSDPYVRVCIDCPQGTSTATARTTSLSDCTRECRFLVLCKRSAVSAVDETFSCCLSACVSFHAFKIHRYSETKKTALSVCNTSLRISS